VVAIGDLNGDGRPDVAVAEDLCTTNCHVIVLLQHAASGRLVLAGEYAAHAATSLAIGDFNGDGLNDIAIALAFPYCGFSIYYQGSDHTFGPPLDFSAPSGCAYAITAADMNGDGRTDLVVMPWGSNTNKFYVYLQQADGSLQRSDSTISGGGYDDIGVADINGDGIPDVFVVSPQAPPRIALRLGSPNATFKPEQLISTPGFSPTSVAAGDLNANSMSLEEYIAG